MRVMDNGGSINADFQCGIAHSNGRIGNEPIVVMNSCKDFRPSDAWVCVCLPGLRYCHIDALRFGIPTRVRTPKELREHMARMLGAGGFVDAAALWQYARKHNLPRVLHEDACKRLGYALDDIDRTSLAAVIAAAKTATCRALA